jgi:acetate kinase
MKILVANLGSTSFKYRLFDMAAEVVLARGGVERIGSKESTGFVESAGRRSDFSLPVVDHAAALRLALDQLADRGCLRNRDELAGIGFKAVHARGLTGVHRIDARVLAAMEAYDDLAPAHNPPYVRAMRLLLDSMPNVPLVAAFETGFHETIPPARRLYAVPLAWRDLGVQRWGFHGASHRYIAERTSQLTGIAEPRLISCHLGGSSSLCAIAGSKSLANSFGTSPQSGLPHNNRAGDFDPFALLVLLRETGKQLPELLNDLASRSGWLGLCGFADLRDVEHAMDRGDDRARLAFDVFVEAVRHYLGSYLLLLNGADAIVFTGGIGENSPRLRAAVCAHLDWFGIGLDPIRNNDVRGEVAIHLPTSRVQIWVMPTNEELIVARQTRDVLLVK